MNSTILDTLQQIVKQNGGTKISQDSFNQIALAALCTLLETTEQIDGSIRAAQIDREETKRDVDDLKKFLATNPPILYLLKTAPKRVVLVLLGPYVLILLFHIDQLAKLVPELISKILNIF